MREEAGRLVLRGFVRRWQPFFPELVSRSTRCPTMQMKDQKRILFVGTAKVMKMEGELRFLVPAAMYPFWFNAALIVPQR